MELLTEDPLTGTETHSFSTVQALNVMRSNEIGVPLIKSRTTDWNHDGKLDTLELELQFRSLPGRQLPITQSIRSIRVLGGVNYGLADMVQLQMIGLFSAYIPVPSGAATVYSTGSLELEQQTSTHLSSHPITNYNTNPFDDL